MNTVLKHFFLKNSKWDNTRFIIKDKINSSQDTGSIVSR